MRRCVAVVVLGLGVSGCLFFDDPTEDDPAPAPMMGEVDDPTIPGNDYCGGVAQWDMGAIDFEEQVLTLVNEARGEGTTCGGQAFGPAAPLTMNGALRCAARVHSLDMFERGFFDHDNPSGESPFVRMERAGFVYSTAGENIASGQRSPDEVMSGWLISPGHCRNIMDPAFTHIGVGLHAEGGNLWTQTFGTPL